MNRLGASDFILLGVALLFSAPRVAHAAESYDNCTGYITSVPTVINTQGTWCLKQNLSTAITTGNAITVATDNVTLDCNDFKLDGLSAGLATGAIGIRANTRLNATVRNCNVRGFYVGLYFTGSAGGGHVVEDNRFDGNTYAGLWLDGDGSVAQRNRVLDTGGSTVAASAFGINTNYSVDLVDNTVSGVTARTGSNGSALGIATTANPSGKIIGNGVRGLLKDGTGRALAIRNVTSGRVTVRSNDLAGDASAGSVGVSCASSAGSVRDNVISGFVTAISNCSNSGGNAILP